jgi:hypothetical protein
VVKHANRDAVPIYRFYHDDLQNLQMENFEDVPPTIDFLSSLISLHLLDSLIVELPAFTAQQDGKMGKW